MTRHTLRLLCNTKRWKAKEEGDNPHRFAFGLLYNAIDWTPEDEGNDSALEAAVLFASQETLPNTYLNTLRKMLVKGGFRTSPDFFSGLKPEPGD